MAAYGRPEASWRRMIPWLPLAKELQVFFGAQYERERPGIFQRLIFRNTMDEVQHPWLTFGLFYDVIEEAWFQGDREYIRLEFPWSIDEREHVGPKWYRMSERLKRLFPDGNILGEGCVLVHSTASIKYCGTGRQYQHKDEIHLFGDKFRSGGSCLADVEWSEITRIEKRLSQIR